MYLPDVACGHCSWRDKMAHFAFRVFVLQAAGAVVVFVAKVVNHDDDDG